VDNIQANSYWHPTNHEFVLTFGEISNCLIVHIVRYPENLSRVGLRVFQVIVFDGQQNILGQLVKWPLFDFLGCRQALLEQICYPLGFSRFFAGTGRNSVPLETCSDLAFSTALLGRIE
jgi:hypothetical protein